MYEFLSYRVRHVMTRDPVTVGPDAPLSEAQALFERHDFDALPVVDARGALEGMLGKLDLCRAFAFSPESKLPHYGEILARPVRGYMDVRPPTVEPDTPLTRALQRMIDARHKSLPVVEAGRLVGIVAREDVLGAVRRAAAGEAP